MSEAEKDAEREGPHERVGETDGERKRLAQALVVALGLFGPSAPDDECALVGDNPDGGDGACCFLTVGELRRIAALLRAPLPAPPESEPRDMSRGEPSDISDGVGSGAPWASAGAPLPEPEQERYAVRVVRDDLQRFGGQWNFVAVWRADMKAEWLPPEVWADAELRLLAPSPEPPTERDAETRARLDAAVAQVREEIRPLTDPLTRGRPTGEDYSTRVGSAERNAGGERP